MANRSYYLTRQDYAEGLLAWSSGNWKVALCSSSYTPVTTVGGDHYLAVIPGGAIVATSANLGTKTNSGGACDAADVTFSAVSGSTITQFVLYEDSGSSATSPLWILYDTATNLPVVPNGGNIVVQWAGSPYFVWAFNFKGLSDRDKRFLTRAWERLREVTGIPVDRTESGLWIPTPRIEVY